jgi:hypothetical protein
MISETMTPKTSPSKSSQITATASIGKLDGIAVARSITSGVIIEAKPIPIIARIRIGIEGPRSGGIIISKGLTRASTTMKTQIEL